MEKLLLSVQDVADSIGVSRSKAYALIAHGAIPSIRIGGSVRVPADALRKWVAQQLEAAGWHFPENRSEGIKT